MYTDEDNVRMLICLLKEHKIKKIVVSPGTTNFTFVGSIQADPFFEIYSSVDERSAAYIACGLAAESGEVVALSCTGATASRNYFSGLTEAFYRKLPVLAITSTQFEGRIGQGVAQVIDRSIQPRDTVKCSVSIPTIKDENDRWLANLRINTALLELKHRGMGPVHINLATTYSNSFSFKDLEKQRVIRRFTAGNSSFPTLTPGRICIFAGNHPTWDKDLVSYVERFCELYDAVVIGDHTSNYQGRHRILPDLLLSQDFYSPKCKNQKLLIHLGEISGGIASVVPNAVWRVSPDGAIVDLYKKLSAVFEMDELAFFKHYVENAKTDQIFDANYLDWKQECDSLVFDCNTLPFSNAWIAYKSKSLLPPNVVLHFGILNSLRVWNFHETDSSIACYSNTGGFGIDGGVSSFIGGSFANPDKLHFGFFGDLAFFYDMNAIGNRHVSSNVRILLVNNGLGTEFKNYNHPCSKFGDDANKFMAGAGHFGNQSRELVKNYAENLGFTYFAAETKEDFEKYSQIFFDQTPAAKPYLFEVFTEDENESKALQMMRRIKKSSNLEIKHAVRTLVGEKNIMNIKKLLGK